MRTLEPAAYDRIRRHLDEDRRTRSDLIERIRVEIGGVLTEAGIEGRVTVSASDVLATYILPPIVARIHAAAPRVEMSSVAAAPSMPAAMPAPTAAPRATLPVALDEVEETDHHVAEVIASYGGTVLDVQHVGQVRSRRRQAPAMFAVGGLMLLAGAGVLANEVTQDWESYQAARDEATSMGRAAPEAPGAGLGGLGIGLALLGLVPFGLGIARRDDVGLETYTLGETHDATFHVPTEGLPSGEDFALVSRHGDDYVLRFTADMKGEVTIGGQRMALHELASSGRAGMVGSSYAFPLPSGAKATKGNDGRGLA